MIDRSLIIADKGMPDHPDVPNSIQLTIGVLYRFQKAGVCIPQHAHVDEKKLHYTLIMDGTFSLRRGDSEEQILQSGDIVDFQLNERHTITSVTPGTIFNGFKYGNELEAIDNRLSHLRRELLSTGKDVLNIYASIKS